MKKVSSILLTLLIVSALFASGTFTQFSAQPRANRVIITWVTENESSLKNFIVQRSNDEINFIDLKTVQLSGPGYTYSYSDNNVLYKNTTSAIWYKVVAIKEDGTRYDETAALKVHPTTTGIIKKSWGAIKAMFR